MSNFQGTTTDELAVYLLQNNIQDLKVEIITTKTGNRDGSGDTTIVRVSNAKNNAPVFFSTIK